MLEQSKSSAWWRYVRGGIVIRSNWTGNVMGETNGVVVKARYACITKAKCSAKGGEGRQVQAGVAKALQRWGSSGAKVWAVIVRNGPPGRRCV